MKMMLDRIISMRGFLRVNMYKVYFVLLNDVIDHYIFPTLLSFVSAKKQHRTNLMRFSIDKKLTIFSEVLVRALVCRLYGVKNDELVFTENEHGKPRVAGISQFHFNISHSRNAIAVAIAEKSVGIDIEKIKETDLNIAIRFFSTKEQAFIFDKTSKLIDRQRRFYEVWTKKEAYLKQIGKGLSIPLNCFDVTERGIQDKTYCFEKEGYIISVCGRDAISRNNIEIIELCEHDLTTLVISSWG